MVLGLGHSFCYRLVFHSLEFKRFFSFSSVLVSLEFCILRLFFSSSWILFYYVTPLSCLLCSWSHLCLCVLSGFPVLSC